MTETVGDKPGPGAMLKAAREARGLHIAALAAAIKVAPRKLDALEHDRWHELPDVAFTRALAQTVCRTLKIDARPVLEQLPQAALRALEPGDGGLKTPFSETGARDGGVLAGIAIGPLVIAAAALMLAAVVLFFLPQGLWSGAATPAAPAVAMAPEVPVTAAAAAASSSALPAAVADAASAVAAVPSLAAVPAPAGETVFAAPPDLPASSATTADATAAGLLQLRTSEASWIDVRDARGQVLLSRTVLPGEAVRLNGALPLRLVIGNAAATQLGFRGQPVDLVPRTRDNVARVELP